MSCRGFKITMRVGHGGIPDFRNVVIDGSTGAHRPTDGGDFAAAGTRHVPQRRSVQSRREPAPGPRFFRGIERGKMAINAMSARGKARHDGRMRGVRRRGINALHRFRARSRFFQRRREWGNRWRDSTGAINIRPQTIYGKQYKSSGRCNVRFHLLTASLVPS